MEVTSRITETMASPRNVSFRYGTSGAIRLVSVERNLAIDVRMKEHQVNLIETAYSDIKVRIENG